MMEDLIEDLTLDENDPSVRCVVLKAEGRVFSAGHDLKELVNSILGFSILFYKRIQPINKSLDEAGHACQSF